MLKSIPPWVRWLVVAGIWWAAWGWGVYGTFQSKENRLAAEHAELASQKTAAIQLLSTVPTLVQQVDSLDSALAHATSMFITSDDLEPLLTELEKQGRRQGISEVTIRPDLANTLTIPIDGSVGPGGLPQPDTLLIDISASGRFRPIGYWLDEIENRADFQQWNLCRWSDVDRDGTIDFAGQAAFWVSSAGTNSSSAEGKNR